MRYEVEKTITIKFYGDGKVSVEAFGYTESLDAQFAAGCENDIEALKYKQACMGDCYELIRSLGKIEEITPKESTANKEPNRIRVV